MLMYSLFFICMIIIFYLIFSPPEKSDGVPDIPCDFIYNRKEHNIRGVKKSSSSVKKPKPAKVKDPMKEQAKVILMELGYTAKEADELLRDISASSVNSYVTKAMNKIQV